MEAKTILLVSVRVYDSLGFFLSGVVLVQDDLEKDKIIEILSSCKEAIGKFLGQTSGNGSIGTVTGISFEWERENLKGMPIRFILKNGQLLGVNHHKK